MEAQLQYEFFQQDLLPRPTVEIPQAIEPATARHRAASKFPLPIRKPTKTVPEECTGISQISQHGKNDDDPRRNR